MKSIIFRYVAVVTALLLAFPPQILADPIDLASTQQSVAAPGAGVILVNGAPRQVSVGDMLTAVEAAARFFEELHLTQRD